MFFCMDMSEVDSLGGASARDSSLVRGYEVLGAVHCSLDDADDVKTYEKASRETSLDRQYDALGAGLGKSPRRSASTSRPLPPLRSHSRGASVGPQSSGNPRVALSAMEMDLMLASDDGKYLGSRSDFSSPRRTSHPMGGAHVFKTISKELPNIVLPQIHSGTAGTLHWDIPLTDHDRRLDNRQLVY